MPDSLLIPEESTPKFYAYTAPFKTFLFHGDLGTDVSVYGFYPHAFSVNLVNDVDPGKLAAAQTQLTAAVRQGDILMVHADYWQANNPTVVQIYADAGVSAPVQTPSSAGVTLTQPASNAVVSGAITVAGQMTLTLDAAGSYLMVDGAAIGIKRVTQAPFLYPLDTTTLANGTHTLQLWAHDIGNDTVLSNPVVVTVANTVAAAAPAPPPAAVSPSLLAAASTSAVRLTYPSGGQAISGIVEATAAITQTLDAAGSYLLIDGAEKGWRHVGAAPFIYEVDTSTMSVGQHTLQVWAHTIGNTTVLSDIVTVFVSR